MKRNIELSTKQEIADFLKLHDQMKGAYFMVTPKTQKERMAFEFHNSGEVTFKVDGIYYTAYAITRCTTRSVLYSLDIFKLNENGSNEITFKRKNYKG